MPINSPIPTFSSVAHYFYIRSTPISGILSEPASIKCTQVRSNIRPTSVRAITHNATTLRKPYFSLRPHSWSETETKNNVFLNFQAVKTVRRHRPQLVENLVHHLSPILFHNPSILFHNPSSFAKALKREYFVENLVTTPFHTTLVHFCISKIPPQKHGIEIFHFFSLLWSSIIYQWQCLISSNLCAQPFFIFHSFLLWSSIIFIYQWQCLISSNLYSPTFAASLFLPRNPSASLLDLIKCQSNCIKHFQAFIVLVAASVFSSEIGSQLKHILHFEICVRKPTLKQIPDRVQVLLRPRPTLRPPLSS